MVAQEWRIMPKNPRLGFHFLGRMSQHGFSWRSDRFYEDSLGREKGETSAGFLLWAVKVEAEHASSGVAHSLLLDLSSRAATVGSTVGPTLAAPTVGSTAVGSTEGPTLVSRCRLPCYAEK